MCLNWGRMHDMKFRHSSSIFGTAQIPPVLVVDFKITNLFGVSPSTKESHVLTSFRRLWTEPSTQANTYPNLDHEPDAEDLAVPPHHTVVAQLASSKIRK